MSLPPWALDAARGLVLGGAAWAVGLLLGIDSVLSVGDLAPLLTFLTLGAGLGITGRERAMRALLAVLCVILGIVALTPVVPLVGRRLVRADGPRPVDVVVVLGAGVTPDGLVSGVGVERMLSGFTHVAAGDTTPMVFSAVRRSVRSTVTPDADIRRLVTLAGGRRVHVIRDVFSTHDEAREVLALATRHGWHRVGVVTSPSHSGRACRTFERVGLEVACWPSAERGPSVVRGATITERIYSCASVVYELLGWASYTLRGWV